MYMYVYIICMHVPLAIVLGSNVQGFLPLVVQHSWGFSEGLQSAYTSLNKSHPFSTGDLPGSFDWPMPGLDVCSWRRFFSFLYA